MNDYPMNILRKYLHQLLYQTCQGFIFSLFDTKHLQPKTLRWPILGFLPLYISYLSFLRIGPISTWLST